MNLVFTLGCCLALFSALCTAAVAFEIVSVISVVHGSIAACVGLALEGGKFLLPRELWGTHERPREWKAIGFSVFILLLTSSISATWLTLDHAAFGTIERQQASHQRLIAAYRANLAAHEARVLSLRESITTNQNQLDLERQRYTILLGNAQVLREYDRASKSIEVLSGEGVQVALASIQSLESDLFRKSAELSRELKDQPIAPNVPPGGYIRDDVLKSWGAPIFLMIAVLVDVLALLLLIPRSTGTLQECTQSSKALAQGDENELSYVPSLQERDENTCASRDFRNGGSETHLKVVPASESDELREFIRDHSDLIEHAIRLVGSQPRPSIRALKSTLSIGTKKASMLQRVMSFQASRTARH